jgi:hypothetical protein
MRLRARLAKLESKIVGDYVGYRMKDGTTNYIACKRVLDALIDVVNGTPSAGAQLMLDANPEIPGSDGNLMHQLSQAIRAEPYVPAARSETKEGSIQ